MVCLVVLYSFLMLPIKYSADPRFSGPAMEAHGHVFLFVCVVCLRFTN